MSNRESGRLNDRTKKVEGDITIVAHEASGRKRPPARQYTDDGDGSPPQPPGRKMPPSDSASTVRLTRPDLEEKGLALDTFSTSSSHRRPKQQESSIANELPTTTTRTTAPQEAVAQGSGRPKEDYDYYNEKDSESLGYFGSALETKMSQGDLAHPNPFKPVEPGAVAVSPSTTETNTKEDRRLPMESQQLHQEAASVMDKPGAVAVSASASTIPDATKLKQGQPSGTPMVASARRGSPSPCKNTVTVQKEHHGKDCLRQHEDARSENDTMAVFDDLGNNNGYTFNEEGTPQIVATLVDEDEEANRHNESMVVAVAQKDSFVGLLRHDRRTRMIAACFVVALVGLGVGLGVALSQNSGDTSEPEETYLQAGSDIDGPDQFFESGSGEGSKFGKAVALSGDGMFLVVGAPEYSSNEDDVVGLVQLFEERDNDWALMETYVGESSGDRMGTAVAASLDGNTVAIASPGYMEDRGQVQFYGRTNSSNTWEPLGAAIVGESPGDELGTSVSISEDGRRVAIGTKKANVTYTEFAKVFDYQDEEWTKVGDDLEGHFGGNPVSLSPDGTTVSLGSLSTEENDFLGAIRVYEFSNNNWARRGTDVLLQGAAGNYSTGWSTSLSRDGKTMAIGSSVENAKAIEEYDLRVEIYRYDFGGSGDWTQQGETQHDKTGSHLIAYRVDLSADAQVLAIGDPGGFAFGVNSGHTHVLRWQNEEWFHITRELEGTDAADRFGDALFLSEDGNRICVGAPSSRATGVEVGRVQIFELAGVE